MDIIRLDKAQLHFGDQPLLDGVDLRVSAGQRIGLLGRNGAGKSTLLKVIAGTIALDGGERWQRPGTRIARLLQELPDDAHCSVGEYVAGGLAESGELLARYERLLAALAAGEETDLAELERVQHALEAADGWQLQQRVEATLTRLELNGTAQLASLSGGWRRRAALARALVGEPDLLLLDEPTNHLDIPSQEILQAVLARFEGTIILVTHDRYLVNRLANQIWEIEEGQLLVYKGNYEDYVRFRSGEEALLETEAPAGDLDWVEEYTPPPAGKREQRDLAHRRYVLSNALEDAEFRLQLLSLQQEKAAAGGQETRAAELALEIAGVERELAGLNEELERIIAIE